jgi:hypothetical protein
MINFSFRVYWLWFSIRTITPPFCEAKHTEFAIILVFLGVDILFILFLFSEFIQQNFEIDHFSVCKISLGVLESPAGKLGFTLSTFRFIKNLRE